jgi:hypothetical protein
MLFAGSRENDHDFWNELVQSALAAPANYTDIYEPILHHLGVAAGIVKRSTAVARVDIPTPHRYCLYARHPALVAG